MQVEHWSLLFVGLDLGRGEHGGAVWEGHGGPLAKAWGFFSSVTFL